MLYFNINIFRKKIINDILEKYWRTNKPMQWLLIKIAGLSSITTSLLQWSSQCLKSCTSEMKTDDCFRKKIKTGTKQDWFQYMYKMVMHYSVMYYSGNLQADVMLKTLLDSISNKPQGKVLGFFDESVKMKIFQSYDVKLPSVKHPDLQLSLHHPQEQIQKVMTLGRLHLAVKTASLSEIQ